MIADASISQVNDYIDAVLSGEIAASRAVQGAVSRHLRDLEKQSTEAFPYYFDADYAARCIRFYPSIIRHSIGRFAGMPFELSPWQKFCTAMIFGWKQDVDQCRRFRKAYRTMARKNGKSSWAAAEAIFLAGYDVNPNTGKAESVSQVVLSATKREQASRVVMAECVRMRQRSSKIEKRSRYVHKEIHFTANEGEIITVGSDRPYDGLNPHSVTMDELHAWSEYHRPFHDTMITGSASRDQPLISYITTAGDDRSHIWREVYEYAKKVALGIVEDESYFAFIAELDEEDDPFDEANWIKANPNLGVSVSLDYLRAQAKENKTNALGINRFTRYHGNRLVSSTEKAFDLQKWDACRGELSDWRNADAIGMGVDLGGRDDLAALAIVARFSIDENLHRYEAKTYSYIASDTERDLTKAPFAEFVYNDLLRKSTTPISEMQEKAIELAQEHDVFCLAFDPSGALAFAEAMETNGVKAARMGQSCIMFNEPIRDLLAAVREKRFTHDGNQLLRWAANNAVIVIDRQDRWMFDKRDSSDKIDPIVALTMAFRMACLAPQRARGSLFLG